MSNSLTVAELRNLFWRVVDSNDQNSPRFIEFLNRAGEKLTYSGKWAGSIVKVLFDSSGGFITLPRRYLSVLRAQINDEPVAVFTQFAEYIEQGYGERSATNGVLPSLFDMGDGFCTQADITTAGTLRVKIADAGDAASTVRLFGKDADGAEVYSNGARGVELTLASPSADTTQVFSEITSIQADPLSGAWSLWVVVGGEETQIGTYEPGDTNPTFRRYKTGDTEYGVRVICQRRFVQVREETDIIEPSNLNGWYYALKALITEDADEEDKAQRLWAMAYQSLNEEAKAARGGAQPSFNINHWGDGHSLPWGN